MKRGKRQIIQNANIFSSQQQPPVPKPSIFDSPTPDSVGSMQKQHSQKLQTDNKAESLQISRIKSAQNNIEKAQVEPAESKVSSSADDERKKRLEMLRQKYLKTEPVNPVKEQQRKPIPPKKEENIIDYVGQQKKEEQKQIKRTSHVSDPFHLQKREQSSIIEVQDNKLQNETPISKPTQTDHHRKQVPAVPDPKRKRAPVPPPRFVPPPPQQPIKEQLTQQRNEVHIAEHESNPIQPTNHIKNSPFQQKKVNKTPVQIHNQNEHKMNQDFQQIIHKWINNDQGIKKEFNSDALLKTITGQIIPFHDHQAQQIFQCFLLSNTSEYSKDQSASITKKLRSSHEISSITKLFFSIKCGTPALEHLCKQMILDGFVPLLHQLIEIRSHLLQSEINNFIKFYLANGQRSQSVLVLLVQLDPTCLPLYQHMAGIQFSDLGSVAKILLRMRNYISEPMCPFYFKLINVAISHIQDTNVLESIVKLINAINFQSAYQLKKDTKLKIIQTIDRITNGAVQPTISRQPSRQQPESAKIEKQAQKGAGINFMGYFNQAIKIIKNQIPQKPSEPTTTSEEPKQSIEWDPVMKRYKINGKVPEDEYGKVQIPGNDDSQDKPKKKAPPPPPPRVNTKPIQPKQPMPEPQTEEQGQFNPSTANQDEQEQRVGVPPPPARSGLRGMNNKKPKMQVRYT